MQRTSLPRIHLDYIPSPIRLYRTKKVANLFGVDPTTIWRWREAGEMPAPVKMPGGFVAWPEDILIAWIKSLPKAGV